MKAIRRNYEIGLGMHLILVAILFLAIKGSKSFPVECSSTGGGCKINNYEELWLDRTPCKAAQVACPKTEKELIQAVADAVQHGRKIKVISKGAHSSPKLVCPRGDQGLLISTTSYSSTIALDLAAKTATVDSGVLLRDFVTEIAKYNLTIPHATSWSGLSIAGLVSTAAHGSGIWEKGSAIHERVSGISIVIPASAAEGYAKIVRLNQGDEDFKAARVSLGVLGVISQITLSLEPMFKRSVTFELAEDSNFENEVLDFAKAHEFGYATWFPSQKVVIYRKDDRVPVGTPGDGIFNGYRATTPDGASSGRLYVERAEGGRDNRGICNAAAGSALRRVKTGNQFLNDGKTFSGYPVIGFNNLMQTAGSCGTDSGSIAPGAGICPLPAAFDPTNLCSWDSRINGSLKFDVAVSINLNSLPDLIRDIKLLQNQNPLGICIIDFYGGILIRFVKGSDAYLAPKFDAADVELWHHRYREANLPGFNQDVLDEIEQILVNKYGGLPHWGKNRYVGFEKIWNKLPDLQKFVDAKNRFDPQGLFSSEWSDGLLGLGASVSIVKDYCGLEGLCVCSQDSHCAPEKDYGCKNGLIFASARVCRYFSS